jgi:murein DD-endopeptidase MepM/ murein hydrolase activator NlpD
MFIANLTNLRKSVCNLRKAYPSMLRRLLHTWLWLACLLCLLFLGQMQATAQPSGTYTVQPGDTLGEIATRFGLTPDALAAANAIENINVISVGQQLIIPGTQQILPFTASHPGETLEQVAARWNLPLEQLSALNELDAGARLFPGQPVYLPPTAQIGSSLRFGSVEAVHYPRQVIQGRTAWLEVESSRPLSISVEWNQLPLPLAVEDQENGRSYYRAHIPVPALLGPGEFPLQVSYTTRSGAIVRRTFPVQVVAGNYTRQEINLPPDRGALLEPELMAAENALVIEAWSATDTPVQWRGPFQRPISEEYRTTSPYGIRRSYNGGPYNTYHAGQDFGAPVGVPVTAPAAGIVALADPLTVRGNAVIIDHGRGLFTGYWHLSEMVVEVGQQVDTGDLLGLVGNTGLSTGAHLHWELRIYGIAVDPMQFLDEPLFP